MSNAAKDFIMGIGEAHNVANDVAANLLLHVDGCRVFYYPAWLLDWKPLHLFHSFCDVFLMCDWSHTTVEVRDAIQNLHIPGFQNVDRVNWAYHVDYKVVTQITDIDGLPWQIEGRDATGRDAWALYARLNRVSELGQTPVHVIYLHGNPVMAYRNLFVAQQTAPKFVCLKYCPLFPLEAWNAFTSQEGPLFAAMRSGFKRPQYLLRDIDNPLAL